MTLKIEDDSEEIKLQVYSCFKPAYLMWKEIAFGMIILFYLILSCLLGDITNTFLASLLCIIYGIVYGLDFIIRKLAYKRIYSNYSYKFYKNRIIYKDKWLNFSEKEIKYENIRDITLQQTFVQKFFNIGNIIMTTNKEAPLNIGICIRNVQNPEEMHEKIKSICFNDYEKVLNESLDFSSNFENEDIVFQLKPKFNLLYMLIMNLGLSILLGFIPFLPFGLFISLFVGPVIFYWWIGILISFVIIKTIFDKKHMHNIEYNFYKDKIEYKDNLFSNEHKTVRYEAIKKVVLKQSFLEKFFNIGRIILSNDISFLSALAYVRNQESAYILKQGMYISHIGDVQDKYNMVKKIIEKN